jgi:hypothetical protein
MRKRDEPKRVNIYIDKLPQDIYLAYGIINGFDYGARDKDKEVAIEFMRRWAVEKCGTNVILNIQDNTKNGL